MKERVFLGDLPLTVPISDNRRADLACRLMYAIAASPDIRIASQDEEVFLTQDVLRIVDECGNVRVPEPDLEWFGTAEDNQKVKDRVVDRYMEDAALETEPEDLEGEREYQSGRQEQFQVCVTDEDGCLVSFTPLTWDRNKVDEMYNCLKYGMDPAVTMTVLNDYEEDVEICPADLLTVGREYDVYKDHPEPDWADNSMPVHESFLDAVNGLKDLSGMEL